MNETLKTASMAINFLRTHGKEMTFTQLQAKCIYYLDDGRPSRQMHGADVQW